MKILVGFFWQPSMVMDEQCDFNCSAITKDEQEIFVTVIKNHVKEQFPGLSTGDAKKESARHHWPDDITYLTVSGAEVYNILVSWPMFASESANGQLTRGYWGVDMKYGEVMFIKDIWLTDVSGVEVEGSILESLSAVGVWNVPKLVCHRDVLDGGKTSYLQFM